MHLTARRPILWVFACVLLIAGCEDGLSNAWYNAWLDPTQVGNFRDNRVVDIQRSISFRDTPVGIAGAEDPKPEDLVATVEEYEIGPGDTVQIRMLDFIQIGMESEFVPTVDELGYIDIPQLDRIQVEGLTAREVQDELIQRAKGEGIYHEDEKPTVTAVVVNAVQRRYGLSGAVLYPGEFRISRPDFRLRDAINQGGGLEDTVKMVWVFRNPQSKKEIRERPSRVTSPSGGAADPSAPSGEPLPAPPVSPVSMAEMGGPASPPGQLPPTAPAAGERPTTAPGLVLPAEEAQKELIDALAEPKTPAASPTTTTPPATAPAKTGERLPTYTFVNDAFIEAPVAETQQATAPEAAGPALPPADWDELVAENRQRIIRIPADRLRNGDANYNIVIEPNDWIRVDPGPIGLYYMDGHVARPGPYQLSGEQVTLTQAVVAAGGFDQLAWPTRCEVIRRLDMDRQEITQWDLARIMDGKDPDFYLKPNDTVRVGTHPIAPLLATIRNSFRFTYGFGFVYDRNFADIDAYGPDTNPNARHREERESLFSGLF